MRSVATEIPAGKALVGGGFGRQTWRSIQEFEPAKMGWVSFPSLPGPRSAGTLTWMGKWIVAAGGSVQGSVITTSVMRLA